MSQSIETLIDSLESQEVTLRREAAELLARLGSEATTAAIPLVKACGDQDGQVRDWVVAALEELGSPEASNIDELTALVDADNLDVAFWATTLIGRMEAGGAPAVDTLAKAVVSHSELVVRQRAAWALGKIGQTAAAATTQLEQATTSDDARLARFASNALEAIRG